MASSDINSLVIVGRLVRDAELAYLPSGSASLSFSIAVNRSKKENEQWITEASFFNVSYFGKPAEAISQYMKKGTQVAIHGSLRQERWTDKSGEKKTAIKIVADQVEMLSRIDTQKNAPSANDAPRTESAAAPAQEEFPEDIPF